jgi:hypothetical protein
MVCVHRHDLLADPASQERTERLARVTRVEATAGPGTTSVLTSLLSDAR